VDNSFASRILEAGVLDTSATVSLPEGADQYIIDDTPALTPIDFGEVSINVDTAWFAAHGATPPTAFEDLAKAEHKDRFVAINPSTSSTGLAFLLATVAHFGTAETGGFADYWRQLAANGMRTEEVGNDLDRSCLLYATNNTQHLQLVFKIQAVTTLYFHRTRTFANNFVYSLHCLFVEFLFRKFVQAVGRIEDTATTLCNFCIA